MSAYKAPSSKGNQNSTTYNEYFYECTPCGWKVYTKERKAFDRLIRLHNKKCEAGSNAPVSDFTVERETSKGAVRKQTILQVTDRGLE